MNSRDADIDDQIAQIMLASAAEAEANARHSVEQDVPLTNGRAKRKRTAEEDRCVPSPL